MGFFATIGRAHATRLWSLGRTRAVAYLLPADCLPLQQWRKSDCAVRLQARAPLWPPEGPRLDWDSAVAPLLQAMLSPWPCPHSSSARFVPLFPPLTPLFLFPSIFHHILSAAVAT